MNMYPRERRACPYRSRRGILFGVCKGLANHCNISVFWTRVVVLLAYIWTGFWPVGAVYLGAALFMRLEPVLPLASEAEEEFYQSYTAHRGRATQRVKRTFENLDRRIRRMEDLLTSREWDWDRRFHER